jgi:Tol biopolymer transport system component
VATSAPVPPSRPDDIAYLRANHIWRVHSDGSEHVQLTRGKGEDFSPAWSPDHASIAFVRSSDPDFTDTSTLEVISASGVRKHSWAFDSAINSVSFSPDGKRIAVVDSAMSDPDSSREWQRERVLIFDTRTETSTVIWTLHDLFSCGMVVSWSPDGKRILVGEFRQDAEGNRVGILTVSSKKMVWLKTPDASQAHWSPTGASILVNQTPQGYTALSVANVRGVIKRVVTRGSGWDGPNLPAYGGSFSPDGAHVAYDDGQAVWSIGVDGTGRRKVVPYGTQAAWSSR